MKLNCPKCRVEIPLVGNLPGDCITCPECAAVFAVPSAPTVLFCPHCGDRCEGDGIVAGRDARCPSCGNHFVVPVAAATTPRGQTRLQALEKARGSTSVRTVLDVLNLHFFGFVLVCFFLPLVVVRCGAVEIQYSGLNLALGTEPSVKGLPPEYAEKESSPNRSLSSEDKAKAEEWREPFLAFMPALALLGIIWTLFAWKTGRDALLGVTAAALFAVLLYYAVVGTKMERKITEILAKQKEPEKGGVAKDDAWSSLAAGSLFEVKKSGWFWAALVLSGLALLSSSVRIVIAPGSKSTDS